MTRDWSSSEFVESLLRAARDGCAFQAKLEDLDNVPTCKAVGRPVKMRT